MLKTILVPLDDSYRAEGALTLATTLSIPTAARLVLVHVCARHGADSVEPYLQRIADELRQRGFWVETAVVNDARVANGILSVAEARDADLIVMTTHGRNGAARWLLGSVAETLVTSSPVPIMLQRAWDPGRRSIMLGDQPRILVPVDGSQLAEAAVPAAVGLADDLGGEVLLLRVDATSHDVVVAEEEVAAYMDNEAYVPLTDIRNSLDELAERTRITWPGVRVSTQIEYGDPATAIVQSTQEVHAAMVVMATHGRTGLQRMTLGSVADAVLHRGVAPLVVVRPAALRINRGSVQFDDAVVGWPR